jgi:hypothetical protein
MFAEIYQYHFTGKSVKRIYRFTGKFSVKAQKKMWGEENDVMLGGPQHGWVRRHTV